MSPTISLTGAGSVDEGSEYTLTLGGITDPGADTVTEWIVYWGDGESDTYGSDGEKTHVYTDDGIYGITVDLVNEDGTHLEAGGKDVTVVNVAPTVGIIGAPTSSPEGTEISLSAQVDDPGARDTYSYSWAVTKDGNPYETGSDSTFGFTPDDDGSYVVSLVVTDDDTGEGDATPVTILVTNVVPTIIIEGGDAIAEGAEYTLTLGEITDAGDDTVTEWIVHWGDGESDTYSSGGEKTHTYVDDDPSGTASDSYTIRVDLVDEDGTHTGAGGKEIAVTNMAPTVEIVGAPADMLEGEQVNLSALISDPGVNDTHTYSWVVTKDGSLYEAGSDSSFTFTPDDGDADYVVSLTVTDDDTGVGNAASKTISVFNVTPTIVLSGDAMVDEGADYTLTLGAITDPGDDTVTQWIVHWGDGQSDTYTGGGDRTHVYSQDGTFSITVDLADEDGTHTGAGSLDVMVQPAAPEVVDLGPIDFLLLEHLNLADGNLFYRLETTHAGSLTLQIDTPKPSKSARLRLYGADPVETAGLTPLKTSTLDEDRNRRIDWDTAAETVYYVEVYGSNTDFAIRIANLANHVGTLLTVHGTDSNDTFQFDASASRSVTINGVHYHFADAAIESVTFDGGEGFDVVEIRDSPGDDTLTAESQHALFSNSDQTPGFTVELAGFEDLQAYAVGGGRNTAILHGSAGDDKLKSYLNPDDDFVRLRAKNQTYSLRAKLFDQVIGDAGPSGNDMAVFGGSDGNDEFNFDGSTNTTKMEHLGHEHSGTGFGRVIARAGGGNADLAHFTDMPGEDDGRVDDVFYFKPHKTQLVGQTVNVTARAFDEVHAEDINGGFGVARIYDTAGDDHFEFIGNTARVYRKIGTELDLLYEAIAFERVKAYRSTGDDTKDVQDHDYQLYLYGWDE